MRHLKMYIALVLTIVMAAGMFTALGGEKANAATKPGKPGITLEAGKDGKSVKITIAKTTGASGYYIYMKGPSDSKYKKIKTLKKDGTAERTFTKKDLTEGKYSFKVKAYAKSGKKTVKGKFGKAKSLSLTGSKEQKDNTNDNNGKVSTTGKNISVDIGGRFCVSLDGKQRWITIPLMPNVSINESLFYTYYFNSTVLEVQLCSSGMDTDLSLDDIYSRLFELNDEYVITFGPTPNMYIAYTDDIAEAWIDVGAGEYLAVIMEIVDNDLLCNLFQKYGSAQVIETEALLPGAFCMWFNDIELEPLVENPENTGTEEEPAVVSGDIDTSSPAYQRYLEDQEKRKQEIHEIVAPYLAEMNIKDSDSMYLKVKKVHDWMVLNLSYDGLWLHAIHMGLLKYADRVSEAEKHVPYDIKWVLENKLAICSGYAAVFKAFMDELGYECIILRGIANGDSHAWNMIKMDDGHWYHVDVCWDDPVPSELGKWDEWIPGTYRMKYFLRSDENIIDHYWGSDIKADGTYYEKVINHDMSFLFRDFDYIFETSRDGSIIATIEDESVTKYYGEFDIFGHPIKEKSMGEDEFGAKYYNEYEFGHLIKAKREYGGEITEDNYEYNDEGLAVKKTSYRQEGDIEESSETVYEYNKSRTLIKQTTVDSYDSTLTYEWNDAGILIKETSESSIMTTMIERDDSGKMIRETMIETAQGGRIRVTEYVDNKPAKLKYIYPDGTVIEKNLLTP